MNWQFWQKPQVMKLTDRLRITLRSQFKLDDETLDRLRYVSKSGHYSGRQVRNMILFDPQLLTGGYRTIKGYHLMESQRQAILFEGHIDRRNDYIYLSDRRQGKDTATTQKAAVVASSRQRLES